MRRGGEDAHVRDGLGDDDVGDQDLDSRYRDQCLPRRTKGLNHRLGAVGERGDGAGVVIDLFQVHPDHERVMFPEPAGERFDQLGDL